MRIKKRTSLMLVVVVVLSLCVLSVSAASDAASPTQIDTPYVYPLQPGTPEWNAIISRKDRAAACQIPEDILPAMTTRALAETVLNYPFLSDMYAWNTTSIGFHVLLDDFNGLRELVSRSDGLEVLRQIQQEPRTASQDGSLLPTMNLETLIEEMTRYEIQTSPLTAPKAALSYPSTPAGTVLRDSAYNLTWGDHNTTFQAQKDIQNNYLQNYPSATLYQNVAPAYNCHSFAWYSQSVDNLWWINDPSAYMRDGSYHMAFQLTSGVKVFYSSPYIQNIHSAIAVSSSGRVRSKWGCNACFEHDLTDCPYSDSSDSIQYYA